MNLVTLCLLEILPDCCFVEVNLVTLTCWGYCQIATRLRWIWSPSLVGDTARLLLDWGESGHPHLLGYCQIAALLRWIWSPSLVGDTTRILLGWCESGHPHLLEILPDCCFVEVNLVTLTCWRYYQIAALLRLIWSPSLVGDTARLLLDWGESGHPHLLGILPDCCWVEVNMVTLTCWGYYQIAALLRWIWSPSLVEDTARLLLDWCESGHPHLLGILPDCYWVDVNLVTLTCWGYCQITAGLRWIWSPSLVGDTTRILLGWCESGHPHLLEILPDCCFVEVNLVTLTCWRYYQIAALLRLIWSPSLVGDTARLLLDWGESGHPHLLGILPDCCWVEVNMVTLTCWGYYQIAALLRWIWSPSLVEDTARLLLDWCESGHPHLLGILPDCYWVDVNLVTLTCWGYCQITAGLRWIWSPSLVGDTARLLLDWGESGHSHLLGILPLCCWVDVNLVTLTCWGYYQIATGWRWVWPPSLVGDTTRLLLDGGESGHPHLLGILPDLLLFRWPVDGYLTGGCGWLSVWWLMDCGAWQLFQLMSCRWMLQVMSKLCLRFVETSHGHSKSSYGLCWNCGFWVFITDLLDVFVQWWQCS